MVVTSSRMTTDLPASVSPGLRPSTSRLRAVVLDVLADEEAVDRPPEAEAFHAERRHQRNRADREAAHIVDLEAFEVVQHQFGQQGRPFGVETCVGFMSK